MIIEKFTISDLDKIAELQPPDWNNIIPSHQLFLESNFCDTIKITVNSKIIGVGTSVIHDQVAWLAQIIVHPEYRNKGIGKIITQFFIDKLNKMESIYLLATPMGEPVYRKLGFIEESAYIFFKEGNIPKQLLPSTYLIKFSEKYRKEIFKIDNFISGENRQQHLEEYLINSILYIKNEILEGYYIPDLSEGPIIATTATAGLELMKLRLLNQKSAICPEENKIAIAFLQANNFKEYRRAKRMRIGKIINWKPEFIYNRISGQVG